MSRRANLWHPRARLQLRAGDESARRDFRSDYASRNGLRLPGNVLPGKKGAARRARIGDLRVLTLVCLLDSGGAVRKLSAAVQLTAQYSCGYIRCVRVPVAAALHRR